MKWNIIYDNARGKYNAKSQISLGVQCYTLYMSLWFHLCMHTF